MNEAFRVHTLTEEGRQKAFNIAVRFDSLLESLETEALCGKDGREMALVRTHLEQACFFAKKAMAKRNCEP